MRVAGATHHWMRPYEMMAAMDTPVQTTNGSMEIASTINDEAGTSRP